MYCGTCGLRGLQAAGLLVGGSGSLPTQGVSQYWCWQVGDQGRAPVLMSWREDSTVAPASTSVHVVERAPQMPASSVCVPTGSPRCLLTLQEALQDQHVGLTQAPFKLLLLPWVLECVCPLRVESLFPIDLWVSQK